MSTRSGSMAGSGFELEFRAEAGPNRRDRPIARGTPRAGRRPRERRLGIAGLGRPAAVSASAGPDGASRARSSLMICATCSSWSRSASSSETPSGICQRQRKRQQMSLLLADDLGPRMGRRDIRAGRGREPIDQAVEPSVVVRLQDDGVLADEDLSDDRRESPEASARVSPRSGDDRAGRTARPRETWDRWDREVDSGPSSNELVGRKRGQQARPGSGSASSGERTRLDREVRLRSIPLAERLEVHRVERGARARDVAPQCGDRAVVIGDPEAAQAPIAIRDRAGARTGGQQLEGRRRGRPEPLARPTRAPARTIRGTARRMVGGRPETIRVLLPGGNRRVHLEASESAEELASLVGRPSRPASSRCLSAAAGIPPGQRRADERGQRCKLPAVSGAASRQGLLELGDALRSGLRFPARAASAGSIPPRLSGCFWSRVAQDVCLARSSWLSWT